MSAGALASVAVVWYDGSLGDGTSLEAAWALGGLDTLAGGGVEYRAW